MWSVLQSSEATLLPPQQALSTFPPSGLRTEQDLYVRLIDSMSKQVSQPRDALAFSDPHLWGCE